MVDVGDLDVQTGKTQLDGGAVTTTANQHFHGDVTLDIEKTNPKVTFKSKLAGDITFDSKVDAKLDGDKANVVIETAGVGTFGGRCKR